MSYVRLEGQHRVWLSWDDVPIGAILPGDMRGLLGKVIKVSKDGRGITIHLVTDVRYEEGHTHLSFQHGGRA